MTRTYCDWCGEECPDGVTAGLDFSPAVSAGAHHEFDVCHECEGTIIYFLQEQLKKKVAKKAAKK